MVLENSLPTLSMADDLADLGLLQRVLIQQLASAAPGAGARTGPVAANPGDLELRATVCRRGRVLRAEPKQIAFVLSGHISTSHKLSLYLPSGIPGKSSPVSASTPR